MHETDVVTSFSNSVTWHFPDVVRSNARERTGDGFTFFDVCFILPTAERSGIALLENGSFETWNLNGSLVTSSLASALARAADLVRDSFFVAADGGA